MVGELIPSLLFLPTAFIAFASAQSFIHAPSATRPHLFLADSPAAHTHSQLQEWLLCSSADRTRGAVWREGSERPQDGPSQVCSTHTSYVPVLKLSLVQPLKQPPGDYLQDQIVADFRCRGSTVNHQSWKGLFSKELKAGKIEELELEELILNSLRKGRKSPCYSPFTRGNPAHLVTGHY